MATKVAKHTVVMVRHGESEWNQFNLFCGWYDAKLSPNGEEQAKAAGKMLKEAGYQFDITFTSALIRTQQTLLYILNEIGQPDLPKLSTWRLNERHYGSLTGLNKQEVVAKYGEEQVQIWRRSFDQPPPPIEPDNPYYDQIVNDPRYANDPECKETPKVESLKHTMLRTIPYWENTIVPEIKRGKRVLIVAHGTSLRGIVKHLDNITNTEIMKLNLPNCMPFIYELDENLHPIVSMKFLADTDTVQKAMEEIAAQGKRKKTEL